MSPTASQTQGPQVLALGLGRTGTLSLAVALGQLGYKNVYHDQNMVADRDHFAWLEKAAESVRPDLNAPGRTPPPKPWGRAEWNEGFGSYDAIVDWPCFFSESIIKAYPDAKVILTIRDYDKWFESWNQQCLIPVFGKGTTITFWLLWWFLGFRSGFTARKSMNCIYGADLKTLEAFQADSKRMYNDHCDRIMKLVPTENLLVYRVGKDGWEPLCDFLHKDVPDAKFPWVNTKPEQTARVQKEMGAVVKKAALRWVVWATAIIAGAVAFAFYTK